MIKIEYRKNTGTKPPQRSKEEIMETSLYKELEGYQNAGISLMFNGRKSNSLLIATYVREESDYMRDYQFGADAKVCGIGFDRIKSKMTDKRFPEYKP